MLGSKFGITLTICRLTPNFLPIPTGWLLVLSLLYALKKPNVIMNESSPTVIEIILTET